MPDKKGYKKSSLNTTLKLVWILVGALMIVTLIEGLRLLLTVREYFP